MNASAAEKPLSEPARGVLRALRQAIPVWRRVLRALGESRVAVWLSAACGALSGLLFVLLLLVLVGAGQLLVSGGTVRVSSPEDLAALRKLAGTETAYDEATGIAVYESRGLLPLAWQARNHWHGPALALLYRWSLFQDNSGALAGLLFGGLLAGFLRAGLGYLGRCAAATAVVDATARVQRALLHHRMEAAELSSDGEPSVAKLFVTRLPELQEGLWRWVDVLAREPFKVLFLALVAMLVQVWLAVAVILLASMGWFVFSRWAPRIAQRARLASDRADRELKHLVEGIEHTGLWRGYLMERPEMERFESHLRRWRNSAVGKLRSQSALGPAVQVFSLTAALIVLFLAGANVLTGQLALSDSMLFYGAVLCLYWPIVRMVQAGPAVQRAVEAAAEVFDHLDRAPQLMQAVDAWFLSPMQKRLELREVTLVDSSGTRLLDDVSFSIEAGRKVAVLSGNPAEARAFVFLVPRFLDPTHGQIRIDGQNIRLATWESLRSQVAMVLQDQLIFTGSVGENIGCGDPGYKQQQIMEAAKLAHCHNFILSLPEGYDTAIGEHGHSLDLGQQYRIALARAALRDPAILVIEEPAQPLDEAIKGLVDDTLSRLCPGRTVLFLPHRMTTLRQVDEILLLHHGKVVARGDHRELTQSSELYRHLQYVHYTAPALEAAEP